jgi:flagellar biosynthetic protein FliR
VNLSVDFPRWDMYMLVLVRVAAMVMVAPVLGARPVPAQVKIGLSLLLAMLLTPLQPPAPPLEANVLAMVPAVAKELVVGLLLGFAGAVIYSAVQMSARLINVQIGFGLSNVLDPLSAESGGFLDSFYSLLAVVIFLGIGGHHALIAALAQSFDTVPLGEFGPAFVTADRLMVLSSVALATAVRLAMPIIGTLLLTDASIALVVRTIPQMNIFAVGLPVKIVVGMFMLAALAPVTVSGFTSLSHTVSQAVTGVLP